MKVYEFKPSFVAAPGVMEKMLMAYSTKDAHRLAKLLSKAEGCKRASVERLGKVVATYVSGKRTSNRK